VKLLLIFLLACVIVGLFTERLDRRVYAVIAGGALFTTALFFTMGRWWV
jgi:uncharacterized SAM-binding protein YcdF (DUF218 family)